MQPGRFSKKFFEKNIAAFQMVGYSAWYGEDAPIRIGSTIQKFWAAMFQGGRKTFAMFLCSDLIGGGPQISLFV